MNALPIIIGALCVMAIAYRYYSAFIAGITTIQRTNGFCLDITSQRSPALVH